MTAVKSQVCEVICVVSSMWVLADMNGGLVCGEAVLAAPFDDCTGAVYPWANPDVSGIGSVDGAGSGALGVFTLVVLAGVICF